MKSYDFFLFALKAALAINGGAAVALLALLGDTLAKEHSALLGFVGPATGSLYAFSIGVIVAAWAGFCGFAGLRGYGKGYWDAAIYALAGSLICFSLGLSFLITKAVTEAMTMPSPG